MLTGYLACLKDGSVLDEKLTSQSSGVQYMAVRGIPRFVVSQSAPADYNALLETLDPYSRHIKTVQKAFEYQWKKFARGEKREYAYGFDLDYLKKAYSHLNPYFDWNNKSQVVLDCGCGDGAGLELFAREGMTAMGFDLTDLGVEATLERNKDLPGFAGVVQGNILQPPFKKEAFDLVYATGVIHYAPDPKRAFQRVAALVKPGGLLQVSMYRSRGALYSRLDGLMRSTYDYLPTSPLYYLSWLLAPLLGLFYTPYFKNTLSFKQKVQLVYDWISPRYQHYHTPEQIAALFAEQGFGDLHVTNTPISCITVGRKKR